MYRYKLLLSLLLIGSISSCSSNEFQDKLDIYSSDNIISSEEYADLKQYAESNTEDRKISKFLSNGKFDSKKIETYLKKKGITIKKEEVTQNVDRIKFYLESSGSIDGYLIGNTSYKNDLTDLLLNIKNEYGINKLDVLYINNRITSAKIGETPSDITNALTIESFKNIGDRSNSDLNTIINNVLQERNKNEISFIVSDMIYSIKGAQVNELLRVQQSFIKDSFNKALKKEGELSTLILQLDSNFNGTFYSYDNSKTQLQKQNRPYFIFVFGVYEQLTKIIQSINLINDKVINYHLFVSNQKNLYYSVLKLQKEEGSYKQKREGNSVKEISDIKVSKKSDGSFVFTLGVDFSELYLTDSYVKDPKNYTIEKGGYDIVNIQDYDERKLHQSSQNTVQKSNQKITHLITFKSNSRNFNDLLFSLKKLTPSWIKNMSTEDDTNINQNLNKVFGFNYLYEGINEAYINTTKSKDYQKFLIKINK